MEKPVKHRWQTPHAAYVHVPFCAHHCGYCDFAVVAGRDALIDRYLDALAAELATVGTPRPVETIFLGGGTPTHLSPRQLERLLAEVGRWLGAGTSPPPAPPLLGGEGGRSDRDRSGENADDPTRLLPPSPLRRGGAGGGEVFPEFTTEANPGTLTPEKVAVLAAHGVNRLSLGAQGFQGHVLRFLERDHDADAIRRAVDLGRQHAMAVSLDLIFGVPGQTLDQWRADLRGAIDLGIDHVSTYGLTYEKGTPLWKRRERGEVAPLDEELERAMYAAAMDDLAAAGFEQYEISNFARPGFRSRHNQVYWANAAYFGFGLGAAGYVEGRRAVNTRDLHAYLQKTLAGESPVQQSEELPPEERARETAMVQLRRAEGIDRAAFRAQTGYELDALCGAAVRRHVTGGLLADDGRRVALTREGKFLADLVCGALWEMG